MNTLKLTLTSCGRSLICATEDLEIIVDSSVGPTLAQWPWDM